MTIEKGNKGEIVAEKYLLSAGYNIIARKFHSYWGEIDIICQKEDVVVFVEVKNYKAKSLVSPYQSITANKQRKIIKTAQRYIMLKNLTDVATRFDVLIVQSANIIDHLEGAFIL
jgi:putative endonuclease